MRSHFFKGHLLMQAYTKNLKFYFFLLSLIILSSCSKFDKDEPIPSYISIPTINLTTDYTAEGTSSNKIADAWVYIDNKLQGVYELPAKFPVLNEGEHTLKIRAGIKENGIGSLRPVYPFFTAFETTINLQKQIVTEINPIIKYQSFATFDWKEDFDGPSNTLVKTTNSNISVRRTSAPDSVFEGAKSLVGILDDAHPLFECASSNYYVLPKNGASTFLELNYKTNTEMEVGFFADVLATSVEQSVVTINPSIDANGKLYWNKIYINLTSVLENYQAASGFKIYFRVKKSDSVTLSEFYLDNIKLIE